MGGEKCLGARARDGDVALGEVPVELLEGWQRLEAVIDAPLWKEYHKIDTKKRKGAKY